MASLEAGAAAKRYEEYKKTYLDTQQQCAAQGVTFVPMVAERSGGWGPVGLKTLGKVAKTAAARSGAEPGLLLTQYLEGLCVTIRRASARAVLKRSSPATSTPWTGHLAAEVLEAAGAD